MDEKGISPCICIFNILNLNQISVIVILVVVHERYPAALKWSQTNSLPLSYFTRPLVQNYEDTGYEVAAQHSKFKVLNHCKICFDAWASCTCMFHDHIKGRFSS